MRGRGWGVAQCPPPGPLPGGASLLCPKSPQRPALCTASPPLLHPHRVGTRAGPGTDTTSPAQGCQPQDHCHGQPASLREGTKVPESASSWVWDLGAGGVCVCGSCLRLTLLLTS